MTKIDVRSLNLNLLPALEALLREESVSGAARRMHVGQSAMSHSLARLRLLFDDPLFVTSNRKLVPTPLARKLAKDLTLALDQLERAIARPEPFSPKTAHRSFRVSTLDYFELTALPRVLEKLRREAPHLNLEIERYSAAATPALLAGEIDLALLGNAMTGVSGLSRHALPPVGFSVIAKTNLKKLDLKTYTNAGHVLVSVEGRRDGVVDRALAARGLSRRVALRVANFTSAPLAVLASDHLCTVPTPVALRARELFGLRVFPVPLALPALESFALWSRRLDEDEANQWLRRMFLESAQ